MATIDPTMEESEAQRIARERQIDALRWVAQEARAIKLVGAALPRGSRLREALAALDDATADLDAA